MRDHQYQIVLPTACTPVPSNPEATSDRAEASASAGTKKKQQHKGQSKKAQPTKAELIIEQNTKRMMDKRLEEETVKGKNLDAQLNQVHPDDYDEKISLIDRGLHNFEITAKRLEMLKKKLDLQRTHLRLLKRKANRSIEEQSKLELLRVGLFATLCEMTHLENVADAFAEKKKFMEELVGTPSPDAEQWYQFQLETINSRLPRRAGGEPDKRVQDFIPDEWQVRFLNAVDNRQSIIIVAPTASGKACIAYLCRSCTSI